MKQKVNILLVTYGVGIDLFMEKILRTIRPAVKLSVINHTEKEKILEESIQANFIFVTNSNFISNFGKVSTKVVYVSTTFGYDDTRGYDNKFQPYLGDKIEKLQSQIREIIIPKNKK